MDSEILWSFTRADADEAAGRPVTDEEAKRIAAAVGFSTAPEACADVVFAVTSGDC